MNIMTLTPRSINTLPTTNIFTINLHYQSLYFYRMMPVGIIQAVDTKADRQGRTIDP